MNKLAASYKTTGSTPVQITSTYSYPVPITSAVAVPTRSYSTPTYQTPAKLGLVYPAPIYTERTKSTVAYQAPAKFNIAVHAPAYPASVKTTPYQLPTKHSGQPARPVNAGDSKPILTAYQAPTKFTSNHKVMYPVPTTYSATAMMAPVYPLSTYPTSVYRLQTYPAVIWAFPTHIVVNPRAQSINKKFYSKILPQSFYRKEKKCNEKYRSKTIEK